MKSQGRSWLLAALELVTLILLLNSHVNSSANVPRGSPKLEVLLAGNKLSWRLNARNASNNTLQFSLSVYSTPELSQKIASRRIYRNMFDLTSFSLEEGTYYIQVIASIEGERDRQIASEVIVYNVTTKGRAPQKTSFTTLVVAISGVVGVAVLAGSILFALTMWGIRSRGRTARRSSQQNQSRQNKETESSRERRGVGQSLCGCCCVKHGKRVGRLTQPIGPQLRTIQTRDKNGGLLPLHVVNREASSCHSDLDRSSATKPVSIAKPFKTDDLPYGYISPADINLPPPRKFSKSKQPAPQREGYVNVEFTDSATQRKKNYGGPISLSESIYSVPCSLTASMEEDYDNTQHYLSVIQS